MDTKDAEKKVTLKVNPKTIKALALRIQSGIQAGAGNDGAGGGHPNKGLPTSGIG